MTDIEPAATAALAEHILAIEGVSRLYPAGGVVARATAALGSAISGGSGRVDDILVGDDRITIRLGVDPDATAAGVSRAVFDATRAWAREAGLPDASIDITVSSIDA